MNMLYTVLQKPQTVPVSLLQLVHISPHVLPISLVITSLHTVNGQHEPAYLETNMIASECDYYN